MGLIQFATDLRYFERWMGTFLPTAHGAEDCWDSAVGLCFNAESAERSLPTSQPGSLGNSLLSSSSFDFWACRNRDSPTVCSSTSLPSGVARTSQDFSQFYFRPFRLQLWKYWSISAAFLSIPSAPPDFGYQKLLCAPQSVCLSVSCW